MLNTLKSLGWKKLLALGTLVSSALLVIAIFTAYLLIAPELPSTDILRDVRFQVPLRVFSSDGKLIAEFGEKKRIPVKIDAVPDL